MARSGTTTFRSEDELLYEETAAVEEVQAALRAELSAARTFHASAMRLVEQGSWKVTGAEDITPTVVMAALGLLAKALKTYRAIELLASAGLGGNALIEARALFECGVCLLFILEQDSRNRVATYIVYVEEQKQKMLRAWKDDPKLATNVTREAEAKLADNVKRARKLLPKEVAEKPLKHWSGKQNLREVLQLLDGDTDYLTVYKRTSAILHVSDVDGQFIVENGGNDWPLDLGPSSKDVTEALAIAQLVLHSMMKRIVAKFKLKYEVPPLPTAISVN